MKSGMPAAVWVGLIAARVLGADDSVAALKALGAEVKTDAGGAVTAVLFKQSARLLTDEDYKLVGGLKSLKEFTFYGDCLMTDAQAKLLAEAPALEKVAINGTRLTDEGMKGLAGAKALKTLTIWHLGWKAGWAGKDDKTGHVKFTGIGLAGLAECPKLESLNIAGSTTTDDGLAAVGKLGQLTSLTMYHTRTTDAGLSHIAALKGLKSVTVGPQFSMRIGDAGVARLAELPALETLEVNETILTWEGSMSKLAGAKNLKAVKFDKAEISDEDMAKLKAALPAVKITWTKPSAAEVERMRKELARRAAK